MAGNSRRMRRPQKAPARNSPRSASAVIEPMIRNPEIVKNTSTPMKPPVTPSSSKWNRITASTEMARMPSICGR